MVKMHAFIMQNSQNSLFLASSIKRFPNSVKTSNFPLFNQFLLSKKIGQQQSVLYIQSFLYSDGFYIQFSLYQLYIKLSNLVQISKTCKKHFLCISVSIHSYSISTCYLNIISKQLSSYLISSISTLLFKKVT